MSLTKPRTSCVIPGKLPGLSDLQLLYLENSGDYHMDLREPCIHSSIVPNSQWPSCAQHQRELQTRDPVLPFRSFWRENWGQTWQRCVRCTHRGQAWRAPWRCSLSEWTDGVQTQLPTAHVPRAFPLQSHVEWKHVGFTLLKSLRKT